MSTEIRKPVIGFTCGDLNGIGLELIIKSLSDSRMLDFMIPVVFANNKSINFYRKGLPEFNLNFAVLNDLSKINPKQVNVLNCWEEEVEITPGELTATGGKYALISLEKAVEALKQKTIDGIVTAPIHKKNIQSEAFNFSGHTPYLQHAFGNTENLMLLVADNIRMALVTEHVTIGDIAKHITKDKIKQKLAILHSSLQKDFGVDKPRIAVLALNPHAGDEGLIGKEEIEIIKPAIKESKQNILVFGPYSADAFFARGAHEKFDGVLAMYHDQGLIPFKSLAFGEGVNFTAGLPIVRTSPDHGTAFDIAGKNKADASSFTASIFECVRIIHARQGYHDMRLNPLKKMSARMFAGAVDERLDEA
ncbi:MAG: 4-hydroxythreonine-4-phosphate dehydrogenase PdxA [Chitinophagaceae bacterium]|jgi:4-hydroxythreonine-4-phosphate dehydrogenase|nr:4-hydroxythreonine-4-phosphate dehydrogenase PdxA [Sediminibacterium sp.]